MDGGGARGGDSRSRSGNNVNNKNDFRKMRMGNGNTIAANTQTQVRGGNSRSGTGGANSGSGGGGGSLQLQMPPVSFATTRTTTQTNKTTSYRQSSAMWMRTLTSFWPERTLMIFLTNSLSVKLRLRPKPIQNLSSRRKNSSYDFVTLGSGNRRRCV